MENVIDLFKKRGLLEAITSDTLADHLKTPKKVYIGFDPTAESLHLGSLVGIVVLKWFEKFGHIPVVVLGGGTGRIGDPSGKSQERTLLQEHIVKKNVAGIKAVFEKILEKPLFFDNYSWFEQFSAIDFLRDVGKYFRIGPMLAKESVKTRLNSKEGLSFTEFSYSLLQGYDFYKLFLDHGVTLQAGGSDQWGNIVSGMELIHKKMNKQVFGLTYPLLTKADGTKYGKTESGTIWLSQELLSVYEFYQFFIRTPDHEVIKLLKFLTLLDLEEIDQLEKNMNKEPQKAQIKLAQEVTALVHGREKMEQAQASSKTAFCQFDNVNEESLKKLEAQLPTHEVRLDHFLNQNVLDFLTNNKMSPSKSQLRRLMENGGFYLNEKQTSDYKYLLSEKDLIGTYALFSFGKKKKILVKVIKN
jgi:tyrosyl-tRNA synthetase